MSEFLRTTLQFLLPKNSEEKKKKKKKNEIIKPGEPAQVEKPPEPKAKTEEEMKKQLKDRGKLFVGGLKHGTTSERLTDYFSRFGKVVDAVAKPQGYGFVTFADPAHAEIALGEKPHVLEGKTVDVKAFVPKDAAETRPKKKEEGRIFLKHVPPALAEEDLKLFFARYGVVEDVYIHSGKSGRCAFLSFETEAAAENCLKEEFVYLGGRRLAINKADPRGKKSSKKPDLETGTDCMDESAFGNDEDDESVSSTNSGSFALAPEFMQLLKDHFQSKMASFCNASDTSEADIGELERLLTVLFKNALGSKFHDEETNTEFDYVDVDGSDEDLEDDDDDFDESDNDQPFLFHSKVSLSTGNSTGSQKTPFTITNPGFQLCQLCGWSAPDDSSFPERFLAHCQTAAHMMKMKERFSSDGVHKSEQKTGPGSQGGESFSRLPSSEAGSTERRKRKARKRNNTQSGKMKTNQQQQQQQQQKKKNPNAKTEHPNKNFPDLQIQALAKGMVCIQPISPHELNCKMCNKRIPKAVDFTNLMRNVSNHLQSKRHLSKLAETENSLKTALEKKGEDTRKVPKNRQSAENEAKGNPKTGPPGNNCLGDASKKNKGSKKFLCLHCNYFANKEDTINRHINSNTHVVAGKTKSPKLVTCVGCSRILIGSLYDINQHFSKCPGENN